jgi:hypothetical protein
MSKHEPPWLNKMFLGRPTRRVILDSHGARSCRSLPCAAAAVAGQTLRIVVANVVAIVQSFVWSQLEPPEINAQVNGGTCRRLE